MEVKHVPCVIAATYRKEDADGNPRCRVLLETPWFKDWASIAPENFHLLPQRGVDCVCDLDVWYKKDRRYLKLKAVR